MANKYWENRPKEEHIAALIEQNDAFLQDALDLHNALDEAQKSAYEEKKQLEYLATRLFDFLTETQRARLIAVSKPRKGHETTDNLFFYKWIVERNDIVKELLNGHKD